MSSKSLPRVLADLPVSASIAAMLHDHVELVPWHTLHDPEPIVAIYTYGHPTVNAELLDRLPGVRVISNFGVGVDHIDVPAATARGIPVGNTPGILDGATADMAFTLLLAAGRRLIEGDRYARGPNFCATIRPVCWAGRSMARRWASSAWAESARRLRDALALST